MAFDSVWRIVCILFIPSSSSLPSFVFETVCTEPTDPFHTSDHTIVIVQNRLSQLTWTEWIVFFKDLWSLCLPERFSVLPRSSWSMDVIVAERWSDHTVLIVWTEFSSRWTCSSILHESVYRKGCLCFLQVGKRKETRYVDVEIRFTLRSTPRGLWMCSRI